MHDCGYVISGPLRIRVVRVRIARIRIAHIRASQLSAKPYHAFVHCLADE